MTMWKDKTEFKNAVLDWASKLNVKIISIFVRPMKRKWASCSTNGNLHFNSDLLNLDRKLGEYVIVHELLHFRTPNHGRLWKSYMNIYLSTWQELDRQLREITKKQLEL